MAEFFSNFFTNAWGQIVGLLRTYNWLTDTLDILLVAFIIYNVIKLVRDSRAEQLLKGIVLLAILYAAASLVNLKAVTFFLQSLFGNAWIILVIIFQPELRRALERAGHSRFGLSSLFSGGADSNEQYVQKWQRAISAVCTACELLQRQKMGALIVFERTTKLGEIINSGTVVDADPTGELIGNIFFNKAPLHDGAMIMRDGRVHAAGCILPLSDNLKISRDLGTRHRAAVGMSENSDALVVVVSEETGTISVAMGGVLKRNFSSEALRVTLENGILWDRADQKADGESKRGLFRRWKSK